MSDNEYPKVMTTILENIGNTPMVELQRIPQAAGLKCKMFVKCEFFNAGGSIKDRIGRRMVEEAEKDGTLTPGQSVLIEPTSGNTGIGIALAGAIRGYRTIIVLPEKMSDEKVNVLKGLGAEIVRTPTEAAYDSPESHISVAARLRDEIPHAVILDQYKNPYNIQAHYDGTGPEIWDQTEGKITMLVAGAGTGGTISGVSRFLKEKNPDIEIVGVDPLGSILAEPAELNTVEGSYHVEGIGYDFIPDALDRSVVDRWVKSEDKPSFLMARRLIREEGLLCGGSSGTAVYCALEAAKDLGEDDVCVVILPDSIRNYMTKHLTLSWMDANGFLEGSTALEDKAAMEAKYGGATVADLNLGDAVSVTAATPLSDAVTILQDNGFDQLPVVGDDGAAIGVVTLGNILSRMSCGRAGPTDGVETVMFRFPKDGKKFKPVTPATPLSALQGFFEDSACAFVTADAASRQILHVVTAIDLVQFLAAQNQIIPNV